MTSNRRQFLASSLSAGALASLGLASCRTMGGGKAREPKRILILGGTGFLGPALINAVLARGHQLSIFNSGRTEKQRADGGRPSVVPEGVEVLVGNRDPLLTADDRRLAGDPDIESKRDPESPRGLSQLAGKRWDAVIDTSGYFPRIVRASAEFLAPFVDQYIYVSSISVYADESRSELLETDELEVLPDPDTEDFGPNFENYGAGKAASEAAAELAMPGRTTNVRPGFIVGRRDSTRRFTYWPWRVAQGGTMLVPGTPDDPFQFIDVRDLAEWMVRCAEEGHVGVYNATGPAKPLAMGELLAACNRASGTETEFLFADHEFVRSKGVPAPMWTPPGGDYGGLHRARIQRALTAGLTFRSTEDTARSCLEWYDSLPPEYQAYQLPEVSLENEAAAVEEWRSS